MPFWVSFPTFPFLSWLYCCSFKHQQLLFSFCLNSTGIKFTKWGLEIWLVIKNAFCSPRGCGFVLTPPRDESQPPVRSFRRSYSLHCLLQAPTHVKLTPTHTCDISTHVAYTHIHVTHTHTCVTYTHTCMIYTYTHIKKNKNKAEIIMSVQRDWRWKCHQVSNPRQSYFLHFSKGSFSLEKIFIY